MKNIRKLSFLFFIILGLVSQVCFAADGSSGCGPGWYVLKDNSILSSALRATTNGILIPTVTLGMTFGTSNCTKHSIVKNEVEHIKYATENLYEIAADSTRAQGPFLNTYAELMGCKGKHQKTFNQGMQRNFKKIFNDLNSKPQEVIKNTYIMILESSELRQSCFQAQS